MTAGKVLGILSSLLAGCALALTIVPSREGDALRQGVALRVEPELLDLGPVFYGSERRFQVRLRNPSDSTVKIASIKSGCGCTSVDVSSPVISPGGTEWLRGALRSDKAMGDFQHMIHIAIADPRPGAVLVRMKGKVVSRVRVSPSVVVLRPGASDNAQASGTILLTNDSTDVMDFESPRSAVGGVQAELSALRLTPGQSTQLRVQADTTFLTKEDLVVEIPCRHGAEKSVKAAVRIEPHNALDVTPRQVEFGVITRAMLRSRMPLVITISGEPLAHERVSIVSLPPYLTVAGIENGSVPEHRVKLTLREQWKGFDLGGEVAIGFASDGGSGPPGTIRVRLHGFLVD